MAEKKPTTTSRLKPERVQSQLKSERVQGQLRPEQIGSQLKSERVQVRLKPERVQSRLQELPGWGLAGDGRALERTYLFPTIRAAVAFVVLVAEIGEAREKVPPTYPREARNACWRVSNRSSVRSAGWFTTCCGGRVRPGPTGRRAAWPEQLRRRPR